MTAEERAERARTADELCRSAYESVGGPEEGVALVAVGGYGRAELAPYSDLDVVLVHDEGVDPGEVAAQVWYPLWDARVELDHAVRSFPEMTAAAEADLRVALGLLDLRHLAGDPNLTLRLRSTMLAQWRRQARERLPELRNLVSRRHERSGELAHVSVPDVKETAGGLRDATVLRALVATWLVDVSHSDLERCRQSLLDVRDHVHDLSGRATDRIPPEMWGDLADRLKLEDAYAAQVHVRRLGRRLTHLSHLAWRRVEGVLRRPSGGQARRPRLEGVAPGVALSGGEVVLDASARPAKDPLLLLRAAVVAAERDVVLAPPTAARLARDGCVLPDPWPTEARQLMVRLLASGDGLLDVWETLDETGALRLLLPEWERIRLLPHASAIHRFTVDRHVIETCIEASRLIRRVPRPDVLVVAALLHDIGKGGLGDHAAAGEPLARDVARRMGFDEAAVDLIGTLVREHLLLGTAATTRDPEDPATVTLLTKRLTSPLAVDLMLALAEADARAASPQAWSSWRAQLITGLAYRARSALDSGLPPQTPSRQQVPIPLEAQAGGVAIEVERTADGERVRAVAPDRVGLLTDLTALFALHRIEIRAAHVWSQDQYGVSEWDVADQHLQAGLLRTRFEALRDGRLDPARLHPVPLPGPGSVPEPVVVIRPEASSRATVLEVRTRDQPGVVHRVCAALAELDISIRSAHVDTLGPQAVDVFYLQEPFAGALTDLRAAEAAHAVRAALSG
ncbi:[protein-PII] uridylyltransferase [Nocardioides insulae]|uniref:[protein-PII] uridylyltransferase n=1 Tax=Nocardioides insulae TaxID=394734 RepID=UPI00041317E6|nr:[protein-PII] uridylyltransferase [Nocardioides insulae]